MNGPLASRRIFLSELPSLPLHSKVRFLGCVMRYEISTGRLILEHQYPATLKRPAVIPVDINLLLETIKSEHLQVGAWLNVLGYSREQTLESCPSLETSAPRYIEAIMIFSAGAINIGEYERVLRDSLEVERRAKRPS